jgi:lipoic acid synthetase
VSPSTRPVARPLHARWLGRVPYHEALTLQRALHGRGTADHLLLLEHPSVYTLGRRSSPEHVLADPAAVGADLVEADRGGDVTWHGPGQLVGYPIVTLPTWKGGLTDVVRYVRDLEAVLVAALADLGLAAGTEPGMTGVWVGDRKLAAIGVKVTRGRTMHGFALNVDPDLSLFDRIVPCGIRDRSVTSLARELGGGESAPSMREVAERVTARFAERFGFAEVRTADVAWRTPADDADLSAFSRSASGGTARAGKPVRLLGRLAAATGGTGAPPVPDDAPSARPEWMKVRARLGGGYAELKGLVRDLDLHTVCEEAGCPNIYECWGEHRTATFMILGERCTRACGFCLVDTRHPLPLDPDEPARVAEAVARLELAHVVLTSPARDDLPDGGAGGFVAAIAAIRDRNPSTTVEVLIPDCRGDAAALDALFAARPDVLNHNLETVARLQRAVRPNAGYARSLAVLARARDAGLRTKSGLIVGLGEEIAEVHEALLDLRSVGVDVLTVGQYLRPSGLHLPIARFWTPDEFAALADVARDLGFTHVESGPLVRSSYHARDAVAPRTVPELVVNH